MAALTENLATTPEDVSSTGWDDAVPLDDPPRFSIHPRRLVRPSSRNPLMRLRPLATIAVLLALVVGACGAAATPTPEPSPTPTPVCAALDDLRASVDALEAIDPLDDGIDAYPPAVEAIRTDLGDLRAAAGDQLSAEIDALETAITDLQGTIDSVGEGSLGGAIREIAEGLTMLKSSLTVLGSATDAAFAECDAS